MSLIAQPTPGILRAPYLGSLVWQIEYGITVCLRCQVTIGPNKDSIRRHFLSQHQAETSKIPSGLSHQLRDWKERYQGVEVKRITQDLILEQPIEGLKVVKAFMCGFCSKTALSTKTIKNHCSMAQHDPKKMRQVDANLYSLQKPPIPIMDPALLNATEAIAQSSRSSTVDDFTTPIEISPLYSKLLKWFSLPESTIMGDFLQYDDQSGIRAQALARLRVDAQTSEAFGVRLNASRSIPTGVCYSDLIDLAAAPPLIIARSISSSSSTNQQVSLILGESEGISQSPSSSSLNEREMRAFCKTMEISFEIFVSCLSHSSDRIRRLFNDSKATQFLNGSDVIVSPIETQYRREALRPLHRHSLVLYRSFSIRLAAYLYRAFHIRDLSLKYWSLPTLIKDGIQQVLDLSHHHNHQTIVKMSSLIIDLVKWKVGPDAYSLLGRFLHACSVLDHHGRLIAPTSLRKYSTMLMYLIRIASHANFLFEYHGTRLWQSIDTQLKEGFILPFHRTRLCLKKKKTSMILTHRVKMKMTLFKVF